MGHLKEEEERDAYDRSTRIQMNTKADVKPKIDVPETKGPVKISAGDLFKAYLENEDNAETKYNGKIVEVTGVYLQLTDGVLQIGENVAFPEKAIHVTVRVNERDKLDQLENGAKVKIRGTCQGRPFGLLEINDAILVN